MAGIGFVTFLLNRSDCSHYIAADLRLTRWHATMSAILFASFPAVGLRIWSVNSDIAAVFQRSRHMWHSIEYAIQNWDLLFFCTKRDCYCLQTYSCPLAVLGCITLWKCRQKIITLRTVALPFAALVLPRAL
jgi:hypothetical protein